MDKRRRMAHPDTIPGNVTKFPSPAEPEKLHCMATNWSTEKPNTLCFVFTRPLDDDLRDYLFEVMARAAECYHPKP